MFQLPIVIYKIEFYLFPNNTYFLSQRKDTLGTLKRQVSLPYFLAEHPDSLSFDKIGETCVALSFSKFVQKTLYRTCCKSQIKIIEINMYINVINM